MSICIKKEVSMILYYRFLLLSVNLLAESYILSLFQTENCVSYHLVSMKGEAIFQNNLLYMASNRT